MDVGDGPVLPSVDKWGRPDLVPHLSRDHGEAEEQCPHGPDLLVVQEVEVVPPQVQEASAQQDQHHYGHCSRVVGGPEYSYLQGNRRV